MGELFFRFWNPYWALRRDVGPNNLYDTKSLKNRANSAPEPLSDLMNLRNSTRNIDNLKKATYMYFLYSYEVYLHQFLSSESQFWNFDFWVNFFFDSGILTGVAQNLQARFDNPDLDSIFAHDGVEDEKSQNNSLSSVSHKQCR